MVGIRVRLPRLISSTSKPDILSRLPKFQKDSRLTPQLKDMLTPNYEIYIAKVSAERGCHRET